MRARLVLLLAGLALAGFAAAQPGYRAPRGLDGHPDLQGEWTNATFTSLQRPREFAGLVATDVEEAAYVAKSRRLAAGTEPMKPEEEDDDAKIGSAQSEWPEGMSGGLLRIDGKPRSSLIVEPSDGRMPYNLFGRRLVADTLHRDEAIQNGPEDRMSDERCLMALGGHLGPPMLPTGYNAHYQIIQTPGVVAIHTEMIHDLRRIRLGGAHDSPGPQWAGDSTGRWEGDTLVVETVNQHPLTAQRFVSGGILILTPGARVTERFTRTSPTEIRYVFEVEDAAVYTRPWRGEAVFRATDEPMFEYACHEGNYALRNILAGARKKEADAAAAAKAKGESKTGG